LRRLVEDFFHSADLSVFQPDLDAVGVVGGFGQKLFDHSLGESAGSLVLFQNDINPHPGFEIFSDGAFHWRLRLFICHSGGGYTIGKTEGEAA